MAAEVVESGKRTPSRPFPHRAAGRVAIAVGLVAIVVFLPSLADGFVFDDVILIPDNEYVHALQWLPRAFATHLWDVSPRAVAGEAGGAAAMMHYYRPLITVSHLLTWVLVSEQPWAFHLTNVIAHALTAVLATRAATRWTRSLVIGGAIGLVFALHPTRSENVVWVAGRMDIFMLLFGLAALEAFRRFERNGRPVSFALGLVLLAFALLSKEPAVLFPLVLLAERPRRSKLPLVVTAVICGLYAVARSVLMPPGGDYVQRSFTPRAFVSTVGIYAERVLAPWPPAMYFDDGHARWPRLAFGAVVIALTIAALVRAWRRDRPAFWLLASAIAFIAPLLNLVFLGLKEQAQDRFLYAPLFFALCGGARLAKRPLQDALRRPVARIAAAGLALIAVGVVELRTLDFRDNKTFWTAELAQSPTDPYVLRMNGMTAAATGDLATALAFYRRADGPEAQRFQQAEEHIAAHFEEAGILAALLPDGRFDQLRALEAELQRTIDPRLSPSPQLVDGFPVGAPLPARELEEIQKTKFYFWDIALLATRLGDNDYAADLVRQIGESRRASSPLNGVLILARIGQMTEARALVHALQREAPPTDQSYAQITARLDRADKIATARDAAGTDSERHAFEALRLAELGAYWSALRVLVRGELVHDPSASGLVLQLLVACRFDHAARAFAGADGQQTLDEIVAALPPPVRALSPVPLTLEQVLAAAARPL